MRTVIDIDDEAMRLAAEELGTTTKVAAVNVALRRIAEQRAPRLAIRWLAEHARPAAEAPPPEPGVAPRRWGLARSSDRVLQPPS